MEEKDPREQRAAERKAAQASRNRIRVAIIALALVWTFFFNLLIKRQDPVRAFFQVLDTISDDFVMGAAVTILVGALIVVMFSATKLYSQVISNVYSFRMLEDLSYSELRPGHLRTFWSKLLHFEELPEPSAACPARASSVLLAFSLIYFMSWIYVLLFTEALFFVSWSAGVDLPLHDENYLLMLPTLSLAIPFSARAMAYLRYPYPQDYADFMPGAVFVLIVVTALGALFASDDQQFFLLRVWQTPEFRLPFLRNGALLAFIPVFFEGVFWLIELSRRDDGTEEGEEEVKNAPTEK